MVIDAQTDGSHSAAAAVPGWRLRIARVLSIVEWLALGIGLVVGLFTEASQVVALGAAGIGAIWVFAVTAVPLTVTTRPMAMDVLSLAGVLLMMTSMALTGGSSSPFFLLAVTPVLRAAAFGGRRTGVTTGLLAAGLLVAIALAAAPEPNSTVMLSSSLLAILFPALGATVAQIAHLMKDLSERAEEAEKSTSEVSRRIEHLEAASALLARLSDIAGDDELNIVSMGHEALRALGDRYPESSGLAALNSASGVLTVAVRGTPTESAYHTRVPLLVSGRETGFVDLATPVQLADSEIELLHESLRPLAIAFGNAIHLQEITRSAVKEERMRVARELHDEIGPSLASLGLSLDTALLQGVDDRILGDHLESLRLQVGRLVDEVRSSVSDLRSPTPESLLRHIESLSGSLPEDLDLNVALDERRPARPSIAKEVNAIVGEAIRNSARHSGSPDIEVRGWVDFDRGRVIVEDRGSGFDSDTVGEGHFGIMGMMERAERAGIQLSVAATDHGVIVTLEWGAM